TIAEKAVRQAAANKEINAVILRPHLIWGPGDPHIVPRVIQRSKKLVRVGNRNNLVDTIYIDNAADAHILAAKKLEENPSLSGKVYFISQDDPIPMWDMINGILHAADLPPITRSLPVRAVWTIGAILEFVYTVFRISGEPRMTRFVANELGTAHWFDISAAKKDLGYRPNVSTKEGFRRLKEWLTKHPITVE
ncbi:MAG: NAD-dependent epimerase/dehydratase family protein, partial [Desulfobacteraceae bacterium]